MQISYVPPQAISRVPRTVEYLKRVEKYSLPRCDAADFYLMCLNGDAVLWGVFTDEVTSDTLDECLRGVMVTRITPYPKGNMLTVMVLAGDQFDEWIDLAFETLKTVQDRDSLMGIEEWGRPGWMRKLKSLGFQQSYVLMEYFSEQGRSPVAYDLDGHSE